MIETDSNIFDLDLSGSLCSISLSLIVAQGACGKTPCITVHDQEKALKAFEVDESTLNMDQVDVPAGHKVEKTLKAAAYAFALCVDVVLF